MTPPARLAARARMTEGQLYSALITLGLAALLATGLGDVHGVAGTLLAQQPPPVAPATAPPVVAPLPAPAATLTPIDLPTLPGAPAPEPAPAPQAGVVTEPEPAPLVPSASPAPTTSPGPPAACTAQPALDAVEGVLTTVNGPAGGQLPQDDVMAALGLVTGCDPADPAVIAVGLLIGAGQALPDPGLPPPPVLPFVAVPPAVVTALQPLRPAVDEACGLVGTGSTVAALFVWAYPTPVPELTSQALFQALAACGQVRNP